MKDLLKAAQTALLDCMNLKKEETLLVISDNGTQSIGQALYETGMDSCREAILLVMPVRDLNGQEPPQQVAEIMKLYDAVICPTTMSLTHTDARRNACEAGARVATMPGITEDVMIRTLKADYNKIAERTYKLSELLDKGQNVIIKTPAGTNIEMPIEGISAISSTGLVREKGKYGNLPSGESFLMPQEGKSQGVFVVDGSFASVGKIYEQPIKITVKDGYAVNIEGGEEARKLQGILEPLGKPAFNVAEIGIGTNDAAIVTGKILEDEKVMGTAHIALGNNISMGGTCNVGIHVDGVMLQPTVYIDDLCVLENGNLKIE